MDNSAAPDDDDGLGIDGTPLAAPTSISTRSAIAWWASGFGLLRRAPIRLSIVCLLPLVVEGLVQLIPLVGTPLSKIIVPLVGNGILVVFDRFWTTGNVAWRGLLWSFAAKNRGPALQLALISASVFVLQVALATAIYGPAAFDAVVLGHPHAHPELAGRTFVLVLILPGLLPAGLLLFAGPLVVLCGRRPVEAATSSIRLMASSPGALAFTCLTMAAMITVSLLWGYSMLLLLVFFPWMGATGYMAYRDVFVGRA